MSALRTIRISVMREDNPSILEALLLSNCCQPGHILHSNISTALSGEYHGVLTKQLQGNCTALWLVYCTSQGLGQIYLCDVCIFNIQSQSACAWQVQAANQS